MSKLTIFSAPKPFTSPHIRIIQRNAIQSWIRLGVDVEVIIIGYEEGIAENCQELGVKHLAEVARNEKGTPLLSSIFELARKHSDSPFLAFLNADILLLPGFDQVVYRVSHVLDQFLIVGQRWDLDVYEEINFSPGWENRLQAKLDSRGILHPPRGSDYFVFPRSIFTELPDFSVGRSGWDNWMIYQARVQGWAVVDGTNALRIIHQNHDYSHLPGGRPPYRLPETALNVQLAGGKRTILYLRDATHRFENGEVRRRPRNWAKILRDIETFPVLKLHSQTLAELFYAIFHPIKAYRQWKKRLVQWRNKVLAGGKHA